MSPRSRRPPGRGFTLVELVVALGIGAVVVMGAVALLIGQQRAFQTGAADRALQEAGRVAIESLTSNLRMAGFGIDPALAFDFGAEEDVPMARAPEGTAVSTPGFQCGTAVSCRDKVDGPDEIVFLQRNPYFAYPLAVGYSGGTTLTLTGPLRTPLRAGQILQVICFTGNMYWAYVQVASDVDPSAAAQVPVTITGASGTDFPQQNALLADACFNSAAPQGSTAATVADAAKVYKVDRYRYFVQSYDDQGNVQPWGTAGARPYLMLDRGLGAVEVVAPDVEDLQLSYAFPASAPALQAIGATASTAIAAGPEGIDVAPEAGIPTYGDDANAPSRLTQHPANIRAVRVGVVVRSAEFDPTLSNAGDRVIPAAGNRPDVTGPAGFRRLLIETTTAVRNLDARAPFFPVYSAGGDQFNVGGG